MRAPACRSRLGRLGNIVLGFKTVGEYEAKSPYFGALIGRYANRIAGGKFSIDGTEYTLATNNGANSLHGGKKGLRQALSGRSTPQPVVPEGASAELTYTSKDGEEGYPGTLKVKVTYTLEQRERTLDRLRGDNRQAHRRQPHEPLLLQPRRRRLGHASSDHILTVNADQFTPVDAGGIPTGELAPVAGTPFDFRQAMPIGARIRSGDQQMVNGRGYDHNFVVNRSGDGMSLDARAYDPSTGRIMEISSDQPGIQFYTGNFLDSTIVGAAGKQYRQGDGFCLETQHFPDSPNHPDFPTTLLKPGETYKTTTVHKFSTDAS